jgi:hypothetical protein
VQWIKIAFAVVFALLAVERLAPADELAGCLWSSKSSAATCGKGWWRNLWAKYDAHQSRVNVWPEPFVLQDRELVRDPFRIMADNGWKLQNTFGNHLFSPETNELTYAGQTKLHWILTQLPPHRRQVFVVEADTQANTATRVASIYETIAAIAPDAPSCPVLTTRILPPGGDGSYLDALDQTYRSSIPLPRLPAPPPPVGSTMNSGY